MKFPAILTCVFAFALASSSVLAAEGDDTVAQVNESTGSILASDGPEGEFLPVDIGHRFKADDRVMVTEGAKVTVQYDNNCDRTYSEPGVYAIESKCVPVVWASAKRWVIPAAVVGLGIAWHEHNKSDSPPVSR